MPELPEVETVVNDLRKTIIGKTIEGVDVYWEGTVATPDIERFRAELPGQRIRDIGRRGKFVIIHLEQGKLLVHLRMTGQLLIGSGSDLARLRHLRVVLFLEDGMLLFNDMRKFGRMYFVSDINRVLGHLGPEPLDADFTAAALATRLGNRRRAIKALLLDQRVVAGIGNIYADEALHSAGIAPQREACTLSRPEIAALHLAIRSELQRGIRDRGTTLRDYSDAAGHKGEHREHLRVYGRAGESCPRCGAKIRRDRICGRSSFYCPNCQQ